MIINILLAGNLNFCEFYLLYFSRNKIEAELFNNYKKQINLKTVFDIVVIFAKYDLMSIDDEIKEIKIKAKNNIPILIITDNNSFNSMDFLYNLGISYISFNFNPDQILNDMNFILINTKKLKENIQDKSKHYTINFYENKDAFIVDINGTLIKEKLKPLKLMFTNLLKEKIDKLHVIIYIFTDINEYSITFDNIWILFKVWKDLGIDYNKITYLTSSEFLKKQISTYFGNFGLTSSTDLLEVTKKYYSHMINKDDYEIFKFSSSLLKMHKNKSITL